MDFLILIGVIAIVIFLCVFGWKQADKMQNKIDSNPVLKAEQEEYLKERREKEEAKKREKEILSTAEMKCPKCQSDDIFVMGENKKSFSVKKAVAGTVLTGGIGAIAGFAGKKNGYDCFCGDCKHRFLLKDK